MKTIEQKAKNVPAIRFAGFDDEWVEKKLGEMASFSKGRGYSRGDLKENGTPIVLYGRLYTKYETIISDVDTFADAKSNSVYSKGGEVIVPGSGETAEDISIASVVKKSGVLLGGDLNVITPPKNLDSVFLAISISNGKPHSDMAKMAQGKSVVHLHNTDLAEINLPYPNIIEQQKIGSFFSNIDSLISLEQKKYDKLTQVKKSMLEKMFPKEGTAVPEIRFAGFTGDWKKIKFSDMAETRRGLTYNPEHVVSSGKRVLRSSNINEDTFEMHEDDIFVSKESVNIPYVKNGDILITAANGSSRLVGKHTLINHIEDETMVHGGFMLLASSEEPEFLNASMSSHWYAKFINVFVAGGNGAIGNLNKNDLDEQIIYVPQKEEQQKIGSYFSHLDSLISLQQRKLEKLKNIKKSLLEKMFV